MDPSRDCLKDGTAALTSADTQQMLDVDNNNDQVAQVDVATSLMSLTTISEVSEEVCVSGYDGDLDSAVSSQAEMVIVDSKETQTGEVSSLWAAHPVMRLGEIVVNSSGVFEKELLLAGDPVAFPNGLVVTPNNVLDKTLVKEIHEMVKENSTSSFLVSTSYLERLIEVGSGNPKLHLAIRKVEEGKLLAFVSVGTSTIRIHEEIIKMATVNFSHISSSSQFTKELPHFIIDYIVRHFAKLGVLYGLFDCGRALSINPLAIVKCYYFPLQLNKLDGLNFIDLGKRESMDSLKEYYDKVLEETNKLAFRPIEENQIPELLELVKTYLKKFSLNEVYDVERLRNLFNPKNSNVHCYFIQKNGIITDFISYYVSEIKEADIDEVEETLKCAFGLINVATTMSPKELMRTAIIFAKDEGCDLFKVFDTMQNQKVIDELDFIQGKEKRYLFLYNWRSPPVAANQIGIVLC